MSLSSLINVPRDDHEWESWSFNAREQNTKIRQAILAQYSVNLPEYELYPINFNDTSEWLARNEQSHNDFNSVLGLQGADLEKVDFKDQKQLEAWIYLNYKELSDASLALKI